MKQSILDCLTFIANVVAESIVYEKHWGAKFCCKENREAFDKAMDEIRKELDWDNLTDDDCNELRFRKWEESNPLRLIPIWLYKAIPVGTKLTSIGGGEVVFDGKNIDTDTRFGCLAWGIIPKNN